MPSPGSARRAICAEGAGRAGPCEPPPGGALLGGIGTMENYVGPATKYVINKAPCRVILTAPPADWRSKFHTDGRLDEH